MTLALMDSLFQLVQLTHPDAPGEVRTTGAASAQKWIDQGWSIQEIGSGTPTETKPETPPAGDQDDNVTQEV